MDSQLISRYFPDLTEKQQKQFKLLKGLYQEWNAQINVISRKDEDDFYLHHVLHSLAISKIINFHSGTRILDIGTGGGFPGIPLAILFPDTQFVLVDSIGKKIKVVNGITESLGLTNVQGIHERVEKIPGQFDFILSRAVAPLADLLFWTKDKLNPENNNELSNGWICLKGGDLTDELSKIKKHIRSYSISDWFDEPFFETKKIIYVR
ncbi:MAG: 16S rRNA (guanine(527)-N(7))-methyltransferase RsmG [Crocinitomicaceae bacterium]|nr:16S rRNA (guanine(527)-N(7))-methyltransferase RsmG [Crocinitomicaceae bacterium]MCF8411109.1 16S rRNA (guanine(527)-N(7))-methyltransferase RsmG [Crocinitomicaceae bacterium]MCF8444413.1 16S rRNA (guanine(527)-N(7))-methyltransferase RsmG [Crocinitomicaceae bacterium]